MGPGATKSWLTSPLWATARAAAFRRVTLPMNPSCQPISSAMLRAKASSRVSGSLSTISFFQISRPMPPFTLSFARCRFFPKRLQVFTPALQGAADAFVCLYYSSYF